jgi:ABC-type sulfate transport system substrate-binding protein
MFDVEFVTGSWDEAMKNLFGEGGEFDRIYQPARATN